MGDLAASDADARGPGAPDLVLIDGSSYLYRAFHALPPLTSPQGEPTGAVLGVLNMLLKSLREHDGAQLVVVFDAPGRTFRDDLFAAYKAHRPPMPDDLRAQVEPLLEAVQALGLPLLRIGGVEADDVIGTLARRAADAGRRVLISTGDKDMAQLVGPHITLINTMTGSTYDRDGVKAKFDVWPEQIIDYLALVGDSSDGIPGIDKVGPKTAAKWLNQYGTVDVLVTQAAEIPGKTGENLRAGLETLALSRDLATIRCDLELASDAQDLARRPTDESALRTLYTRLGFKNLLRSLGGAEGSATEDGTGEHTARAPTLRDTGVAPSAAPDGPARRRGRGTRRQRARRRPGAARRTSRVRGRARRARARALAGDAYAERALRLRHRDDLARLHAGAHRRRVFLRRTGSRGLCAARTRLCGCTRAARP
jgi:DNA polymerase-1